MSARFRIPLLRNRPHASHSSLLASVPIPGQLCEAMLERYVSVESFVGGRVKSIRVVRSRPDEKLTPVQLREEVRKVWLSRFWHASCGIEWAEANLWNIEAVVEYEDGKQSSILMDAGHVRVQDREGKYWFFRLWPALD
jgi:hypothetical protein